MQVLVQLLGQSASHAVLMLQLGLRRSSSHAHPLQALLQLRMRLRRQGRSAADARQLQAVRRVLLELRLLWRLRLQRRRPHPSNDEAGVRGRAA